MVRSEPEDPHAPHAASRAAGAREAFSRRSFLKGAGGLAAGGALGEAALGGQAAEPELARRAGTFEIELSINGAAQKLEVEPRTTLLAALRERCDPPLTGAKLVCDMGTCGACTVLLDGKPAYACLQLACGLEQVAITTVEGLAPPGQLSAVQEAFCAEDGMMCGFCTPGFVVSVTACLARDPNASEADVRAACAGNVCRCGTYPHIWRAAERARAIGAPR